MPARLRGRCSTAERCRPFLSRLQAGNAAETATIGTPGKPSFVLCLPGGALGSIRSWNPFVVCQGLQYTCQIVAGPAHSGEGPAQSRPAALTRAIGARCCRAQRGCRTIRGPQVGVRQPERGGVGRRRSRTRWGQNGCRAPPWASSGGYVLPFRSRSRWRSAGRCGRARTGVEDVPREKGEEAPSRRRVGCADAAHGSDEAWRFSLIDRGSSDGDLGFLMGSVCERAGAPAGCR